MYMQRDIASVHSCVCFFKLRVENVQSLKRAITIAVKYHNNFLLLFKSLTS